MEGNDGGWWRTTVRLIKVLGYVAMAAALVGNVWRATKMCLDVRAQRQEVSATLANLKAQNRELDYRLKELREASGRDLEMKKRLYLKKDERWLLFEKDGRPLSFESFPGAAPGVRDATEATSPPTDSR